MTDNNDNNDNNDIQVKDKRCKKYKETELNALIHKGKIDTNIIGKKQKTISTECKLGQGQIFLSCDEANLFRYVLIIAIKLNPKILISKYDGKRLNILEFQTILDDVGESLSNICSRLELMWDQKKKQISPEFVNKYNKCEQQVIFGKEKLNEIINETVNNLNELKQNIPSTETDQNAPPLDTDELLIDDIQIGGDFGITFIFLFIGLLVKLISAFVQSREKRKRGHNVDALITKIAQKFRTIDDIFKHGHHIDDTIMLYRYVSFTFNNISKKILEYVKTKSDDINKLSAQPETKENNDKIQKLKNNIGEIDSKFVCVCDSYCSDMIKGLKKKIQTIADSKYIKSKNAKKGMWKIFKEVFEEARDVVG